MSVFLARLEHLMDQTIAHTPPTEPAEVQPVVSEHIGIKPGHCGGKAHILGHRIKVQHVVVWHDRMGMTPTEIVVSHPTISLADVHAALAYYYDHRSEIDADIAAEEKLAAELEAKYPSRLQEKLRHRDAQDNPLPPG
jgi:uncharacterized protein (DUF433 family)